jgi:hypothetical protein
MIPFLKRIADHYLEAGDISARCLIFPNRRSQVFFKKYLGEAVAASGKPIIAPEMLTINDFFYRVTSSRASDRVSLLLELYDCYKDLYESAEPLDEFIFWGDVILGDFDDVDKYLCDPNQIFTNVKEFKEIQDSFQYLTQNQKEAMKRFMRHFMDPEQGVKERFLQIWNILLPLYRRFGERLRAKDMTYEGMAYRGLVDRLETESVSDVLERSFPDTSGFVFIGLNALNECERTVMRKMKNAGLADFCWDFSSWMIKDRRNKASLFMSRNIEEFGQAFPLDEDDLPTPIIEVISVPSSAGQAKLLPSIIKDEDHAVILPDESLLIQVLNSIPPEIKDINVTMGYPMSGSALHDFLGLVSSMQNHLRLKDGEWYFYHSQVWSLLSCGLFKEISRGDAGTLRIISEVKRAAKYYIPESELRGTPLLDLLFNPVVKDPKTASREQIKAFAEYQKSLLRGMASIMAKDPDMAVELEFARKAYSAINLLEEKELAILPSTYTRLLDQLLGPMSVPFNGEPLKGLQIMGPLETRALDFKHLVILSCNEGVFPRRSVSSSFIPPELRKGFGLPTYEYQDAIWAYYFYRMIQRAETVTMVFDSRTEGLKNGEESRFIKQLEYHYNLPIKRSFSKAKAKTGDSAEEIPKTEKHLEALENVTLSASSLKSYLDCPAKFYFSKIENLKEETEVAGDLDSSMLGEVYHYTMQALYMGEGAMDPSYDMSDRARNAAFPGALKEITLEYVSSWLSRKSDIKKRIRSLILSQLHSLEVSGRNLVLEDIIVQYVVKTLRRDKELMESLGVSSFRIIGLERQYIGEIDGFKFVGYIDRMDSFLPGEVRIVDYKTGRVEEKDVDINDGNYAAVTEALFGDNNKERPKIAFQLFLYDILCAGDPEVKGKAVLNSIYQPARFFTEGVMNVPMCGKFNEEVMDRLHGLLAQMRDPAAGWARTDDLKTCSMCDFKMICGR